jgi:two-component system, cell cycle sensor histidine kinase and response regulator CckA
MDGKELADRMRDLRPETHVLFASGYSGDKLAPRGILPSETHFLAKPYDAADVARAVRGALDA